MPNENKNLSAEELAIEIVSEKYKNLVNSNYEKVPNFIDYERNHVSCKNALESFDTLMAAYEMYLKNPLGDRPEREGKKDLHYIEAGIRNLKFNNRVDEWQSYESKVSEYIILKEVK